MPDTVEQLAAIAIAFAGDSLHVLGVDSNAICFHLIPVMLYVCSMYGASMLYLWIKIDDGSYISQSEEMV